MPPRRGRRVSSGLVDAGLAALAALASNLYAVRSLDVETFGLYAICYTAFLTAASVPGNFVFLPIETETVSRPAAERLGLVWRGLRFGIGPGLAASLVGSIIAFAVISGGSPSAVFPLVVSTFLLAVVSPLQDYLRRMLHLAERSGLAALVSVTHLAITGAGIASMVAAGIAPEWVSLGALVVGNIGSLVLCLLLVARLRKPWQGELISFSTVAQRGRWLLPTGLIPPGAALAVSAIVLALVGAKTVGYAEAARVVARPITVVTTGLGSVLRPGSMQAAVRGRRRDARRVARLFTLVTLATGGLYTAAVAIPWAGNPLAAFIPEAYVFGGLVLITCAGAVLNGITFPARYELMGAKRESRLALVEGWGHAAKTLTALGARALGPYVVPLGDAVLFVARFFGQRRALRTAYRRKGSD